MVIGQAALVVSVLLPLLLGVSLMAGDRLGRSLSHAAAWGLAMVGSAATLVAAELAALTDSAVNRPWVPQIGLRLHLVLDGISSPLVILAAAVTLLAVAVSARQRPKGTPGLFYGSLLTVLGGAIAAFSAGDVIAFFIAFEIVLVPMWVLIDRYGDPAAQPRRSGWMFLLYTVLGSMFMLLGILTLAGAAGTTDLGALAGGAGRALPFTTKMIAAVLLTIGLAVKVPLLGLHSWLPRAHTAAPTAGSMVLAAVLLKLGTYGFVRLVVLPMPDAWRRIAPFVAILAVAGIVVGGLVCLVERDLKRLIAWSSIAHMGFVMLALASGQQLGIQAALLGNLAHGLISALLFAVVGALKARRGSIDLEEPAVGLRNSDPRLGFALLLGMAASMGLPGLAGFWGEVLALFSAWSSPHRPHDLFMVLGLVAAFGAVLAAAYSLRVLRVVWQGEISPRPQRDPRDAEVAGASPASVAGEHAEPVRDVPVDEVRGIELLAIGALGVGVVTLGLIPSIILHVSAHEVAQLLGGLA